MLVYNELAANTKANRVCCRIKWSELWRAKKQEFYTAKGERKRKSPV